VLASPSGQKFQRHGSCHGVLMGNQFVKLGILESKTEKQLLSTAV